MRVHDRETVWKTIGAERFLDPRGGETLSSDGNCWLAWDCTIKESEVRSRGSCRHGRLSSPQQPAGRGDVRDSLSSSLDIADTKLPDQRLSNFPVAARP